ncbi:HAD family hydrolase [Streptomyces sp. NPDC057575]|uniref:HAD family hydrolase n=1 Tax=unclassified Streptomyces TaxID=2593676 RepID=UPI0036B750E6
MTDPHPSQLQALFSSAKCVLFDFDGPICSLFSSHSAPVVAQMLVDELRACGCDPAPVVDRAPPNDPLALLRSVPSAYSDPGLVVSVERRLTVEELRAAGSAEPTRHAKQLIRLLHGGRFDLAVTTNNSAGAVSSYLRAHGLADCFGEHVYGRVSDPALLKPDPDCLLRALDSTGVSAASALMIGDSLADQQAADVLGVPFIGYAKSQAKREVLSAGEGTVVQDLKSLVEALTSGSAEAS